MSREGRIKRVDGLSLTMSDCLSADTALILYPATSIAEPMSTQRKNHEWYLKKVCQARMTVGMK